MQCDKNTFRIFCYVWQFLMWLRKNVHESQVKVSYRQLSQESLLLVVVTLQKFSNPALSGHNRSELVNALAGCRNFAEPNEERKKIDKDRQCPPMSTNALRGRCNFAAI